MKEIEELYNDINNAIAKCDKCEDCEFYGDKGDCQNKRIAKALIEKGYRKVEKQSVEEEKFQVYKNIWDANYQNTAVSRQWKL